MGEEGSRIGKEIDRQTDRHTHTQNTKEKERKIGINNQLGAGRWSVIGQIINNNERVSPNQA